MRGWKLLQPENNEALLRFDAFVTGYQAPVIGPVSFDIMPGEVVGLWGHNGSGKSTLLKAVSGQARCFSGRVHKAPGLTLGYQVQHPLRLKEMPLTGAEFLKFAGASREQPPERLRQWLSHRIDCLSGGQYQLLNLWAVLGSYADLVLLDEPTNNLDPVGQQLLSDILKFEQGRRAVLLVSHEKEFLATSCNKVIEVST